MSLRSRFAGVLSATAALLAPAAVAFDASSGLVIGVNPNGPWSFGWVVGLSPAFNVSAFDIENPEVYQLAADFWDVYPPGVPCPNPSPVLRDPVPPNHFWDTQWKKVAPAEWLPGEVGQVYVGTGPCDLQGAIRFTTPATGRHRVAVRFWAPFDNLADARLHIVGGATLFETPVILNEPPVEFSAAIPLSAGQRVEIRVGNGDGFTDLVAVDFEVVPVSPGDVDGDGVVNAGDIALTLGGWGDCPGKGLCGPDLDGDGAVSASDLAIVIGAWAP